MIKACTKCDKEKPLDDFFRWSRGRDGRRNQCKDCSKKYGQQYRAKNGQSLAQYRDNNRAKSLEQNKQWYAANRDYKLAYGEQYRRENVEDTRRRTNEWRQKNPEKARSHVAIRRARMRDSKVVDFTTSQLAQRKNYYGNLCYLCGDNATQVDHVKPLSKGGAHMLCNLRPICLMCNKIKKDKWPYMPVFERGYQ